MNTNSILTRTRAFLSDVTKSNNPGRTRLFALLLALSLLPQVFRPCAAATFPGNARIEISDSAGGLSWSNSVGALTVQCWFKLSIPSDVNLTENMAILVNSTSGTTVDNHAYHLYYDYTKRTIEFSTKGTSGAWQGSLIAQPYPDRWYHIAVVRSANSLTAYVDGRQATNATINVGDTRSTKGVSIGGWAGAGTGRHLYGEVQEVSIYHGNLRQKEDIVPYMFEDQPLDPTDFFKMRGYFKLGYSQAPSDRLRNLALIRPAGTEAGVIAPAAGAITYEETSQAGEQSAFDARRNGGSSAVAPLSGAYSWGQSVFSRPTPGIPFKFELSYSSADGPATSDAPLGGGWHHSFETRVIPAQEFSPLSDSTVVGLRMWNGGIETWDTPVGVAGDYQYSTRRKEYRGEFRITTNCQWTTPERQIYTFRPHDTGTLRGRLTSIRDYNGNEILLQYNTSGFLTQVTDSGGGQYVFQYASTNNNQLQSVTFGAWLVQFGYDSANRLISKTLTNTSGIYTNVPATWRFNYYTAGISSNLLQSVVDPRGNTNVVVAYDEYGRRTNSLNALGRATRLEYGVPDRRQITTTDPEGYKWVAGHDRSGRPISQQDPLGNMSRSTYDERGNRISTTDSLGRTTLFAYDTKRANMIAQTNALGEITRWTYHSFFNKPTIEVNPLGWTIHYEIDNVTGNLLRQWDDLGTVASYTYTPSGLVKTQTDANGYTSSTTYDSSGFRVADTDAAAFTKRFLPNEMGWNLAITNAVGEVTTYTYDLNGNTVRTLDPLGRIYAGTYDANGNLVTQTDPKGQQARFTYDALNQKTSEVDRGGGTNWFAYTPRGSQSAFTNALGRATIYQYDAANRETNTVDALGNCAATVYDANGNAVAIIDSMGQRWTKVLDRLNRTVALTDPFGNTQRTLYDAAGRVRESVTAEGASTTHRYDGRGRMIERRDALGSVWRYDYDGVGNITNITDALGGHYRMQYDVRSARTNEVNQDGKVWTYAYDPLMRLKTQQQPNGNSETIAYDAGSRILSVSFTTGRVNSFLYDDNDNAIVLSRSGSGPATISQLSYDAMDRVQQYTDAFNKTIRYTYDTAGRLATLTYPDGKVLANRYDALDRLADQVFQFSAQKAFTNTYAYDKMGRLIRRTYPNGLIQTNSFDTAGRLTCLSHSPLNPQPSKLNINFGFAYDRSGNTVQSTAQGAFRWPMPALRQEQTRYTDAARVIERSITLMGSTNPQPSVVSYHYDPNGNMTNAVGDGQAWTLTYDEDNRTTSIYWANGALNDVAITNRYDALGRRIARTADGILTGYVLDLAGGMERILCDLDATRTITAWYVHGSDLSFKVSPDGSLTCYHADASGNVVALTDAQANTLAEYAYTPYGRSLGSTNYSAQISNPYLFVGSQGVMEELPGLYFMRARYYSADAGVFLSTDPVKNIGPTWLPLAYAYAEGNPLRFNDPKGEFLNWLIAAVSAVVGAIVNAAVEVVTQLVENHGHFGDIKWGKVGIAAGMGFIQGGIAGLTMGASIGIQMAVGAVVGGVTSVVQTGLGNVTEGKAFAESAEGVLMDFGIGAATGAIPSGGKAKAKPGIKAPKAPGVKPALTRAKGALELPRMPKPNSGGSVAASALRTSTETASEGAGSVLGHLWGATKDTVWGVGSGVATDKLKEFLGVQ